MDTKYNGWTNYETWNCALWMDNNEFDQDFWTNQAQEAYDNAEAEKSFTRAERATLDLADTMKANFEDQAEQWMPDQASMFADFINSSLPSVNWYEIAAHYVDSIEQDEAA